jgi:hypothetical protein
MKKRAKRESTYKQMAFETAIRNPERYKNILTILQPFDGQLLNDNTLLEIISTFYLTEIVESEGVTITSNSTITNISADVRTVNSTRNSDGGFPKGYASRFWTYMRTLSELGFVYAQYNQILQFSQIALMLVKNEIDEQEAFSIQAMKYNRKSPYRNVSNDFNFFKFIIQVLQKHQRISYEQFVVASFSKDGNIDVFSDLITQNTFNDSNSVENFVRKKYNVTNKAQTILRDYPDVVLRLLLITGFVSVQYKGKLLLYLNQNNIEYINDLLNVPINITEKEDSLKHFQELETFKTGLLKIIYDYRQKNLSTQVLDYTQKALDIIALYNIDEKTLLDSIENVGKSKNIIQGFKYVAEPLKLEFFISLLLALKYGNDLEIKPNYKADFVGLPISHAAGNQGDIEVFGKGFYWLIEVTLIRNKAQQLNNETTSVIRHFIEDNNLQTFSEKYLSFVAPIVHTDTKNYYDYSIVQQKTTKYAIYIKPYSIEDFLSITKEKKNFEDMKNYALEVIEQFKKNLD